jgi:biopolymer transport protein ExbD
MAIKSQNKIGVEFSLASMTDIVFLLLIFFMLTSTMVSPNAIKLLLPSGSGQTLSKQSTFVYINDQNQFFINDISANDMNLQQLLTQSLIGQTEGVIVLQFDRTVPMQSFVKVVDAVNQMNQLLKTRHKVILATQPKD